jgi:Zn-dependent protease
MVTRAMDPMTERRRKAREFGRTLSIEWEGAHRLVQWLYDHGLKWVFTPAVLVLLIVTSVIGLGFFVNLVRDQQFAIAGRSLAIGFIVLIVLDYVMVFCHELGHALVIVHNGRRIRSAGFQIYFGSPAFFVESSDGLMMDRRQQIIESFAGPFAQLVLAGIASIIAASFPGWILSETMYKFAVLNYLVVIMNLIPLLELDGYYILADLIEIPDLRERSLVFMRRDLFHKLRIRERFSKRDAGLALYGVLGIAFTIFSLYTAYYYWKTVFGDLVSRLWAQGAATRVLLLILAAFIAGPLLRGLIKLLRAIGREVRAVWRRIQFKLETGWRVEASELIDALPMFEDIPVDALNEIAGRVRLRGLGDGQPVFRQGEQPDAFYVVRTGVLEVVEEDSESGGERRLRDLGRGESFGELGLVTAAPRAATVRAIGSAEVFEVSKGAFDHLLADKLHLPDFEPTLQQIAELRGLHCFAGLSTAQLWELLERGGWVSFAPGETHHARRRLRGFVLCDIVRPGRHRQGREAGDHDRPRIVFRRGRPPDGGASNGNRDRADRPFARSVSIGRGSTAWWGRVPSRDTDLARGHRRADALSRYGLLALQTERGRGLSLLRPRDLRGPPPDAPLHPRALPNRRRPQGTDRRGRAVLRGLHPPPRPPRPARTRLHVTYVTGEAVTEVTSHPVTPDTPAQ